MFLFFNFKNCYIITSGRAFIQDLFAVIFRQVVEVQGIVFRSPAREIKMVKKIDSKRQSRKKINKLGF